MKWSVRLYVCVRMMRSGASLINHALTLFLSSVVFCVSIRFFAVRVQTVNWTVIYGRFDRIRKKYIACRWRSDRVLTVTLTLIVGRKQENKILYSHGVSIARSLSYHVYVMPMRCDRKCVCVCVSLKSLRRRNQICLPP